MMVIFLCTMGLEIICGVGIAGFNTNLTVVWAGVKRRELGRMITKYKLR